MSARADNKLSFTTEAGGVYSLFATMLAGQYHLSHNRVTTGPWDILKRTNFKSPRDLVGRSLTIAGCDITVASVGDLEPVS